MYGKIQKSGLIEIIPFICTSAIWGQYLVFSHLVSPQDAQLGGDWSGWGLDGGHPASILSSLRAPGQGSCNMMVWWLQHPLLTDVAGNIFHSQEIWSVDDPSELFWLDQWYWAFKLPCKPVMDAGSPGREGHVALAKVALFSRGNVWNGPIVPPLCPCTFSIWENNCVKQYRQLAVSYLLITYSVSNPARSTAERKSNQYRTFCLKHKFTHGAIPKYRAGRYKVIAEGKKLGEDGDKYYWNQQE